MWSQMYNGSGPVLIYPNFKHFEDKVKNYDLN